jgi:hypothetical protein
VEELMTSTSNTLLNWLRQEILQVLSRHATHPPLLIWCDPGRVWKDLLEAAAESDTFELWAEDTHELLLRERFQHAPPAPRVVWLPVGREDISYFRVFALQAEAVWELSLPEVLSRYGVDLPSDQLHDLKPLLPAHAKEWLDYPLSYWREHLSPGQVKTSLIDDDLFLRILASTGQPLSRFIGQDRLLIFNRRAVEDFGLPSLFDPGLKTVELEALDVEAWRVQALATLLVTDASVRYPYTPSGDQQRLIPGGPARENALKLLARWQKHIDLMDDFETLAAKADGLTTLQYWARNLERIPPALASPLAENTLFQVEIERLAALDAFEEVARHLEASASAYQQHAWGFWGERAKARVGWHYLVQLAKVGGLLYQQTNVEGGWTTPGEAVAWFTQTGWQIDRAGEGLFREDPDLPGGLVGVRAKLRKAYLRHLDRTNSAFSELLARAGADGHLPLSLPYAGEIIKDAVSRASSRTPVAVVVLDACRYDLGQRLADLLNQGEPKRRAEVANACAPIPSNTPLGMAYNLPVEAHKLQVEFPEKDGADWQVGLDAFQGNLAQAADRRKWLKAIYKLPDRAFLAVADVIDADGLETIHAKSLGKLVFVFEDTLDDHDQVFRPFGLDQVVERYAALVRRLRSGGYHTIFFVTDHGFFHWDPAPDEKDLPKPEGSVLWKSRRAMVGHDLRHPSALKFRVTGSDDLECCIPRGLGAFKTYGGLGFFHGGASLQELIIPVLTISWPQKARKIDVVLKPIEHISSLSQRVEVAPGAIQKDLFGRVDENLLARQVLVKVVQTQSGKLIFKSKDPVSIEPGGASVTSELTKIEGAEAARGTNLEMLLVDADDEEILDRRVVKLMVDMDEWL